MALIRQATAPLRAARCVRNPITAATARPFSITTRRQGGGGDHGDHYDPPGGWLWGIKPGEKAESEGWEWPMYLMFGSFVVTGIALAYKPDTSITTWALEEARRRLEAEGILEDPNPDHKEPEAK